MDQKEKEINKLADELKESKNDMQWKRIPKTRSDSCILTVSYENTISFLSFTLTQTFPDLFMHQITVI